MFSKGLTCKGAQRCFGKKKNKNHLNKVYIYEIKETIKTISSYVLDSCKFIKKTRLTAYSYQSIKPFLLLKFISQNITVHL